MASRLKIWWLAARPKTLPAAVIPVVVGSAFAAESGSFQLVPALLCLGFAVLVQIGTNFANDYYDFMRGADTPERVGPTRAVAAGLILPQQMQMAMVVIFAEAFAVGLGLIAYGGWWLFPLGVLSIASGIAYTGGPYPLGYNGLGDVFVFLFFGVVAVCATFFVQTGEVTRDVFLASIALGLLAANLLVANNYRDRETDARAGKRTLVVRLGERAARWQYALSACAAFFIPFVLWSADRDAWVLLPLVLLPLALLNQRALQPSSSPAKLIELLGRTALLLALYGLLLAIGVLAQTFEEI